MAIYHCSTKTVNRSSGRTAVASSAYRAGEKLEDERTGLTHDFTRKEGVAHSEIISNLEKLFKDFTTFA
ncbi:MAG TPA: MobA/MobL family protein, partial [Fibrobacteraceae bacterium]|nr:MobA/MobL family protein [Fibrobacteraceae bacterium]